MTKEKALEYLAEAFENCSTISDFKQSAISIIEGIDCQPITVNINSMYENMVLIPVVDQFDPKLNVQHLELIKEDIISTINTHIDTYRKPDGK